jgi:peptidyl-prolyl cis-trans isomerase A (cyclophilin A)
MTKLKTIALMGFIYLAQITLSLAQTVVFKTNIGNIQVELYPKKAPITVANFLKYVDGKYYDNSRFYRTVRDDNQAQNKIKISVIQGGRDSKNGDAEAVLPPIPHETTKETGILHQDGVISLAREELGTGSSEFFICIGAQPSLDFGGMRNPDGQGFAAFGKVIKGMEIVRLIQMVATDMPKSTKLKYTSGQMMTKAVKIISITRQEAPKT